ncbi:MAG: hypothetical protein H6823_15845 [Planctomycetaceae bacterium]|nr:hypothetical protein [Planctomycetales bacterium]MCB9939712.1 hypothetical protein [Planctomycetaceae bacterium]
MPSSRRFGGPRITWIVVAIVCSLHANLARAESPWVLVDDFNDGVQNELGGYRSTFAAEPSSVAAMRVDDVFRGREGRSVRIAAERAESGFCGYWIHFFDMRAVEKTYFDAARYEYLSFWVRGAEGGEDFLIKLADERWITKQDSVTFAQASHLLPKGITTDWQEVVIPLRGRHNLDWRQLGGVTFEFVHPGKQVVFVDDIAFKTRPDDMPTPTLPSVVTAAPAANSMPRKLWVWSTDKMLRDATARREMFDLCQTQRIDELWMQLLYDVNRRDAETANTTCTLRYEDDFRALLREAHERRIRVHGLDGYPDFALRENHDIPLGLVDAVIAFNAAEPAASRFDGVHFDNEPYLLVGWHNPIQRNEILQEFLTLNAECQRRIHAHSEMQFGIDIPFWWQERDEATGQVVGEVDFNGKRQAASFHCLDLLDNVGVMNYRDVADGADGMISHGRELLDYADRHGRALIYMGVETFRYEPTPVWFATGVSSERFDAILASEGEHLARISRLNGLRLRTLDDGQRVSLGIELPQPLPTDVEQLAVNTMLELAKHFGTRETSDDSGVAKHHIATFIEKDAEWSNLRSKAIVDPSTAVRYDGFLLDSVMLSKITFADDSADHFQTQVQAAEQYFSRYKHYAGTAIHYYETFRDKLEEPIDHAVR